MLTFKKIEYCEWKVNGFSYIQFQYISNVDKKMFLAEVIFTYITLTYSTDNLAEMLHILFIHKCREVN